MSYEWTPWDQTVEGPALERLTRRLAECPADFLADPEGRIDVAAVVNDLVCDSGGDILTRPQSDPFRMPTLGDRKAGANRLRIILVAAWLLHDDWFCQGRLGNRSRALLAEGLEDLVGLVVPSTFVSDPDRREELARYLLRGLGLRPAGETVAQAQDRLTTLSSAERARVIREARGAEERARQVREELARKRAEEAAATYGQE